MLKGKTPLIIAVVLAVLAGFVAYLGIEFERKKVREGWDTTTVIVASNDIAEGTPITMEMVNKRPIPKQFVTASVVGPDDLPKVLNQRVLVPLETGDPLLWTQFETTKETAKLSNTVLSKGRALTIDVSGSKMSVGGWVRPNDHVDIIGSFRDTGSGEQVAVTLMQNVVVLATGKITGNTNINLLPESDRAYSSITFLLLPGEAEILSLAAELGSLTLTLRNPNDIDQQEDYGRTTIATLLTGERVKALQTVRYRTIQFIRGGTSSGGGTITEKIPGESK